MEERQTREGARGHERERMKETGRAGETWMKPTEGNTGTEDGKQDTRKSTRTHREGRRGQRHKQTQ